MKMEDAIAAPIAENFAVNAVYVCEPYICAHCRRPVTSFGVAIGIPFNAMMHANCANSYDFGALTWPHSRPLSYYRDCEQNDARRSLSMPKETYSQYQTHHHYHRQ
jgi:hypothetical protein